MLRKKFANGSILPGAISQNANSYTDARSCCHQAVLAICPTKLQSIQSCTLDPGVYLTSQLQTQCLIVSLLRQAIRFTNTSVVGPAMTANPIKAICESFQPHCQATIFSLFFSGAPHLVTTAVASLRCQCLQPLDTSLGDRIHDLLDSDTFHALTKLVTSGLLAFMWVAPPCLPDQESFSILQGTLSLMELAFLSGAHVAFAQPSNAISWQQPLLHEWLHRIPHHMISAAQCQYVPLGQATVQSS